MAAKRKAGHIDYAGGFRFVWDDDGTGAIWRDNTEQDYTGEPAGYFRYAPVPVVGLEDALSVCGTGEGYEMTMATLDDAAAFIWGYHAARTDAQSRMTLVAGNVTVSLPLEVAEALADARPELDDETEEEFRALGREYLAAGLGYSANPSEETYARLVDAADAAERESLARKTPLPVPLAFPVRGYVDENDHVHAVRADQSTACGGHADLQSELPVDCPDCIRVIHEATRPRKGNNGD